MTRTSGQDCPHCANLDPSADPGCDCCRAITAITPVDIANRPGLTALAYRVGTYPTFLATMQARLSSLDFADVIDGASPLLYLSTRDSDDPSIALLDAWSVVADVLTFYQERIANEGFLRTATERRSALELARLVGHRPRPGVAASVYLAFTLEQDSRVEIPAGTRAQSVPANKDEQAQYYETDEAIDARVDWNAMKPRLARPQLLSADGSIEKLYVAGTASNLRPNDMIVLAELPQPNKLQRVISVDAELDAGHTGVVLQPWSPALAHSTVTPGGAGDGAGDGEEGESRRIQPMDTPHRAIDEMYEPSLFGALVSELAVPASAQPASPLILKREVSEVFHPASDFTLGLASAVQPAATATLARAWSAAPFLHDDTGYQPVIKQALAMRVKAQPFGATAPLESVLDDDGRLIGQREWFLGPELAFAADYLFGGDALTLSLSLHRYGQIHSTGPITLTSSDSEWSGSLGDAQVEARFKSPSVVLSLLPTDSRQLRVDLQYYGEGAEIRFDDLTALTVPADPAGGTQQVAFHRNLVAKASVDTSGHVAVELTSPDAGATDRRVLALDAVYDQIVPGDLVVVDRADRNQRIVTTAQAVRTVAKTGYGLTAKVTELHLDDPWLDEDERTLASVRQTNVYTAPERIALTDEPVTEPVRGATIELDGLYQGLEVGRTLMVAGERILSGQVDTRLSEVTGVKAAERIMIAAVEHGRQIGNPDNPRPGDRRHTVLHLAEELAYAYRRDTVTIHGNVVRATHGETRTEVLGSGKSTQTYQSFPLSFKPLTHHAAITPAGTESTLAIRVNHVTWDEAESMNRLQSASRGFITRTDNEGNTTVQFGDGVHGARLPSGSDNIEARYRQGLGKDGNVAAEQISLLASQPLGVKGVINPQAASGGADADSGDDIRRNAPLAVTALDRLVSVQDHADFARSYAAIAKASAALLSNGKREVVHVTVAGVDDAELSGSELLELLLESFHTYGDPALPIEVDVREVRFALIKAGVRVASGYRWKDVEPWIRSALLDKLGFARRDLGQDLHASEVISLIHGVRGVQWVDLDILDAVGTREVHDANVLKALAVRLQDKQPRDRISAQLARVSSPSATRYQQINQSTAAQGAILPAQLVYLCADLPDTLILEERD